MATVGRVNTEVKHQLPTQEHLHLQVNLPSLPVKKLPAAPPPSHFKRSKKPLWFSAILEEEIFMARRFSSTRTSEGAAAKLPHCLRVPPSACDKPPSLTRDGQAVATCSAFLLGSVSLAPPKAAFTPRSPPLSQDGWRSGRYHISAALPIAVPALLQPNCLIIGQKLIFPRSLSLRQNGA